MHSQDKIKIASTLTAISIVLGIIENLFPLPIPFVRIGISNIGIVVGLYLLELRYVMLIGAVKSTITAIFSTGFLFRIVIAFPAILIAILVMYLFYKILNKFATAVTISTTGSVTNVVVQFLIIKIFIIKNLAFITILPYFIIVSIITGAFIGIFSNIILKKLRG